ncbi:MAG: DsbA family protein [Candidatus Norongarragalinales archaeon]
MSEHEGKYMIAISIVASALILSGVVWVSASGITNSVYELKTALKSFPTGGTGGVQPTPTTQVGSVTADVNNVAMKGDENAPVTIIEYSDLQCPFCRRFYVDTYKQLLKDYVDKGTVKIYFKHFPLTQIHPAAQKSAEAVECARDQGKFWEFHDKIFDEQQKLKPDGSTATYGVEELKKWAKDMGLNEQGFNKCLDSGEKAGIVDAHLNEGLQTTVPGDTFVGGTPTFVVAKSSDASGGRFTFQVLNGDVRGRLIGAQPYASFKAAIDALAG